MSTKRMKVEFATIRVAGYMDSKQVTNAVTYKIMAINAADFDALVERERKHVEAETQSVLNHAEAKAKVTQKEKKYIDGIVQSNKPTNNN